MNSKEEFKDTAFEMYYNMGNNRSLEKVGKRLSISIRTMERWSVKYNWSKRIEKEDQ